MYIMKKAISTLILSILVGSMIFGMIEFVSAVDSANDSGCKNLYWFDDTTKVCGQKQFCGMYMYLGLQTFESKTQCENALEIKTDDNNCATDNDCSNLLYTFCGNSTQANYSVCMQEQGIGPKCVRGTCKSLKDSDCKSLYWFDNENKECDSQEFCGAYMYLGLETFESKEECKTELNNNDTIEILSCIFDGPCNKTNVSTKKCVQDSDCPKIFSYCIDGRCNYNKIKIKCPNETMQENASCMYQLSNGRKAEIKIMPETASEKAIARLGELGFTIELKEVGNNTKDTTDDGVVYELTGNKQGKFLGIFKIMASERVQIDAETGEVKKIIRPWWSFLASGI